VAHVFKFTSKIRTQGLNARENFRVKAKRVAFERRQVDLDMKAALIEMQPSFISKGVLNGPVLVTLTRVSPSRGLDMDNLWGSHKHAIDQVAEALGHSDDRHEWLKYEVAQRKSSREEGFSIEVSIIPYRKVLIAAGGSSLISWLSGRLSSDEVKGLGVPKMVGGRIRLDCDTAIVDVMVGGG